MLYPLYYDIITITFLCDIYTQIDDSHCVMNVRQMGYNERQINGLWVELSVNAFWDVLN